MTLSNLQSSLVMKKKQVLFPSSRSKFHHVFHYVINHCRRSKLLLLLLLIPVLTTVFLKTKSLNKSKGLSLSMLHGDLISPRVTDYEISNDLLNKAMSELREKPAYLAAMKSFLQAAFQDVKVDEVRMGSLAEKNALSYKIDDYDVNELVASGAIEFSLNQEKIKKVLAAKAKGIVIDDKVVLDKLYALFENLPYDVPSFKWKYMFDKEPVLTFEKDSPRCSSFYGNDKETKFVMPFYWFGTNFPDYAYNFLYTVQDNPYMDIYVLIIDTFDNNCEAFNVKPFMKNSKNMFFVCLKKETVAFEAAGILCESWLCSKREEKLLGKLLASRFTEYPYSFVELRPLYMHLLEKHVSACYTHLMMADADTVYSSFEQFPFEYSKHFDLVTVTQDGGIQFALYLRGQLSILRKTEYVKLLYLRISDFRSLQVYLRRMLAYIDGHNFKHEVIHVDEGGLARAFYDCAECSILHIYGQGWIDSNPDHIFALVHYSSRRQELYEIKRSAFHDLTQNTSMKLNPVLTLEDLKPAYMAPVNRGLPCDQWWIPSNYRQCLFLPDPWPKFPIIYRPSQEVLQKLGMDYDLGTDHVLIAEPKNFQNFEGVSGVRRPLFAHFLDMKLPKYKIPFSEWIPKDPHAKRIYYFYANGSEEDSKAFHGRSLPFTRDPLKVLEKAGLDF